MAKKTIRDVDVRGKRVLMRVDFNVPQDKEGNITNDLRIRAALPTIKYVLDNGGSLVLMSHLGRPKNGPDEGMRLKPAAARLAQLLGRPVVAPSDCVGPEAQKAVGAMGPGDVVLLENVRFHAEETAKPETPEYQAFARQLAVFGDIYCLDAFGSAHRPHASVSGVPGLLKPAVAGFLMEKEDKYLVDELSNPKRPYVAILGGAKVSDKIEVIENLMSRVNALLIGGAMAYTFLKAQGQAVGTSLVEADKLDLARDIMAKAQAADLKLLLPVDHVVSAEFAGPNPETVTEIPDGKMGLDIGPKTRELFAAEIAAAGTVVWNGPMGVFEKTPYDAGTVAVAQALAASNAVSIIGGGDSVAAVEKAGVQDQVSHISTGGGASLELLGGRELPGLTALDEV